MNWDVWIFMKVHVNWNVCELFIWLVLSCNFLYASQWLIVIMSFSLAGTEHFVPYVNTATSHVRSWLDSSSEGSIDETQNSISACDVNDTNKQMSIVQAFPGTPDFSKEQPLCDSADEISPIKSVLVSIHEIYSYYLVGNYYSSSFPYWYQYLYNCTWLMLTLVVSG